MAIPEGCRSHFDTLLLASENGDLCLVECYAVGTGQPVYTLCAVNRDAQDVELVPLAKLFAGNPYDELTPPMEGQP